MALIAGRAFERKRLSANHPIRIIAAAAANPEAASPRRGRARRTLLKLDNHPLACERRPEPVCVREQARMFLEAVQCSVVVLGGGKRLFPDGVARQPFTLAETKQAGETALVTLRRA